MSYFKGKNKEFSFRDLIYKALIFIGTVGVIVYFLPRDGKFNYQFDIDKPWKYGQLMATFDFPIYKDDQVVKREQDSILASFQPYFQLDKNTEKEVIKKLKNDYQTHLRDVLPSTDYIRHIEKILSEVYRAGILSTEELGQLHKDSTSAIMVINDKLASQRDIDKLYSVKQAYAYLLTADTMHYQPNILRQCSLNEYLSPNLTYDVQRTETAKKEVLDNYSWANGIVLSGQKIIDRGEIVNQETYNILESLRKESIQRSESIGQKRLMLAGQVLYVSIFMLCFMLYLDLFRKDYYNRKGSLSLLFALIMFYCVVTAIMVANNIFNVYIIPYAMLPIIIRVFLDSRTAFLTQVVTILICSICLRYPHEFILLQLTAGLIAIFSLRELSQRSQLFRTAILVILTYMAVYFAFELITENDLSKLNGSMYTYFIINGVLLLFTYPLLFLVEKTFGFTSNVTLVELSNINNSLLRRMSETVPGTFQHSMQVANLAAEAANRIGAKSQLVRTGALYHDIGKMENPVFFTENQSGSVNPHKRTERTGRDQPRNGRIETGGKEQSSQSHQRLHHNPSWSWKNKIFLYILEERTSRRRAQRRVIHLSGSQSVHQGASYPDDGRLRRSGITQPARIYGGKHQQSGRQNNRFAGRGRLFQGMSHHFQRHSDSENRLQREVENDLPHPHQLSRT